MKMIEVKLLGELGRKFGRYYRFAADSPREVMSALTNQLAGFKDYMVTAHERGVAFKVVNQDPEGMDYENLLMPCDRMIIAPVVSGSGDVGRILIGVALVALAFIPGVGTATAAAIAAGTAKAGFTAVGSILFSLGTTMVLTGVAGLLTPQQSNAMNDTERKESFLFDRAAELTTQGSPVPILYGRFLAASPLVISASLTTQQVPV
jgi:predicted phage tail protein